MSVKAGAEPHILDIYKADKIPPNAYDRLVHTLVNQPQDVADAFRRLHRERTPLHGGDFLDAFSRMASTLAEIFIAILPLQENDTWRAIVGSDLLEAYIGIVNDDAFFFEPQKLIDSIFNGIGYILMGSQRAKVVQPSVLWSRGSELLWKRIWDNRRLLRIPQANGGPPTEVEALKQSPAIIALQFCYGGLVTALAFENELRNSYIPHMGLYLFVRCNPCFPGLHRVLEPFLNIGLVLADPGRTVAAVRPIFQEAVVEDIGSTAFFERINWSLSRKDRSRFDTHNTRDITELANCTRILMFLSTVPGVAPLMETHQCLHFAMLAIQAHRYAMPTQAYDNVLILLNSLSDASWYAEDSKKTVTIRGEDVVAFLACGLELYITDHVADDGLYHLIGKYTAKTRAMQNGTKPTLQHPRKLLDGLRAGADAEWWPTLRRLQEAPREARTQKLTEKWVAFGTSLGLDAAKERQRHEREMRKHCSWRACQYHKEELPETKLKACAGCGETRYCGRDCQKSDWTKGAHKQRCRRLK